MQNNLNLVVKGHNGAESICTTMGTLTLECNGKTIHHRECLYDATYSNIISGERMPEKHTLEVRGRKAKLRKGKKIIYYIERDTKGGLWVNPEPAAQRPATYQQASTIATATTTITTTATTPSEHQREQSSNTCTLIELHERYGHISFDTIRALPEYQQLKLAGATECPTCNACLLGKTTKPPARAGQGIRSTKPLERLHADLIGPIDPTTPSTQFKYLLVVTDDYSRYIAVKPLKRKSDAAVALIEIINTLEKATNNQYTVAEVQADWGGEFHTTELNTELGQIGITLKETVPRHSETNAVAERTNRTIITMSRTALIAADLPKSLWDKAAKWAAYTKNRIPHKGLEGKVPIEVLFNKNPVNERRNLKPFGQQVICFDYENKASDKLAPRGYPARIIGYTTTYGTYMAMDQSGRYGLAKNPTPAKPEAAAQATPQATQ